MGLSKPLSCPQGEAYRLLSAGAQRAVRGQMLSVSLSLAISLQCLVIATEYTWKQSINTRQYYLKNHSLLLGHTKTKTTGELGLLRKPMLLRGGRSSLEELALHRDTSPSRVLGKVSFSLASTMYLELGKQVPWKLLLTKTLLIGTFTKSTLKNVLSTFLYGRIYNPIFILPFRFEYQNIGWTEKPFHHAGRTSGVPNTLKTIIWNVEQEFRFCLQSFSLSGYYIYFGNCDFI